MPATRRQTAASTQSRVKGKPRGLRRDRDCQSCRNRGVKCDLNRPRCRPCVEQGLSGCEYPQRLVWAEQASSTEAAVSKSRFIPAASKARSKPGPPDAIRLRWQEDVLDDKGVPGPGVEPLPANERCWLIERLSAFCRTVRHSQEELGVDSNDQLHDFSTFKGPQLVSRVDEFLQARLKTYHSGLSPAATSTSPPQTTHGGAGVSDDSEYEFRRLETLSSLNEVLATADPVAFLAIAVFAFFEVVSENAFGEWQRHLRGGRSLLDYHCRNRDEFDSLSSCVPGLAEMIAYFTWWDVIGNVIRHLKRSQTDQEDGLIFLDWHRSLMDDDFFATVGCPPKVFDLFVSLVKSGETGGRGHGESSAQASESRFVRATGQLLQLGIDTTPQGMVADTWRCAAAIAVLTWDTDGGSHPLAEDRRIALESAVGRICHTVEMAPPSTRYYTHMATGVFLGAINACSREHCQVLDSYWQNCQTGEFPRYSGARAQCEEMWREKGVI